jgi:mono/diheme cytochrome c family protein
MERDETGRIGAPPHNENGHTWHHDDALLLNYVREGGMGNPEDFYPMPAFGAVLSDAEIAAVVAYLKTLWTEEQRLIQAERTLHAEQQTAP